MRDIKETICHVADDYESEKQSGPKIYTLPDQRVISVGPSRYRAEETLFRPQDLLDGEGYYYNGIHRQCEAAINLFEVELRSAQRQNIVLVSFMARNES